MLPPGDTRARAARAAAIDRLFLVPFIVPFVAIALGFFVSTLFGEIRASEIDREVALIATNSLPSVEHVAAARSALRHLEVASAEYAQRDGAEWRDAGAAIDRARLDVDHELAEELATGMFPGEADLASAATKALGELDGLLGRMYELSARDPVLARAFAENDVREGVERADAALGRLLSLNAAQAHSEAMRIADVRAGSLRIALLLNLACIALAACAALVAFRAIRRQQAIEAAHSEMLGTRAEELEMFARRVAHDLLSPLSALAFTLSSARRNAERGLPIAEPLARAGACLKRSQRLVDGVLDFARSAASPPPGERTNLRDALDGVLDEVRGEAEDVDILVEPWAENVILACAPGILLSVLSNLLRNSVKYIGDGPDKRVTVRVVLEERKARVEVQDTGPGLPLGLAEHVFEPYVRAANNDKPGLGLGLASVRRFVESHRGEVGVRSTLGAGSTFWFELPRATSPLRVVERALIPIGNDVTGR